MKKKKWLGSLLNFLLPGLGNIYSRNFRKGILAYILFFVVVFSLRFVAYNFVLFSISFALILCSYLYLIISGYRDVKKDRVYEPMYLDRWYIYILVLGLHWMILSAPKGRTLDRLTPVNFARIPTPAMDPALLVGDILAFKKTKVIDRNDVTLFWFPDDVQTMYVKRCIGLPGDSLGIKNSTVFINGTQLVSPSLKFKYYVTTDGSKINSKVLENHGIGEDDYFRISSDAYQFFLTDQQAKDFREMSFLTQVELSTASAGKTDKTIYPKSESLKWNTDFYGPIYIPKKGDKLQLTDQNIDFYLKCIAFENESVEKGSSGLRVNGQLVNTYEFKQNYFFMMGDNRHNTLDSRYWGLLPEDLVIGKAMYLYWGQTRDRIGKEVI